jgi:hypothetical protein
MLNAALGDIDVFFKAEADLELELLVWLQLDLVLPRHNFFIPCMLRHSSRNRDIAAGF